MNGVCSTAGVELMKTSLAVGRQRVVGLKIYALFAVSDVSVGEREYVPWVEWFHTSRANGKTFRNTFHST